MLRRCRVPAYAVGSPLAQEPASCHGAPPRRERHTSRAGTAPNARRPSRPTLPRMSLRSQRRALRGAGSSVPPASTSARALQQRVPRTTRASVRRRAPRRVPPPDRRAPSRRSSSPSAVTPRAAGRSDVQRRTTPCARTAASLPVRTGCSPAAARPLAPSCSRRPSRPPPRRRAPSTPASARAIARCRRSRRSGWRRTAFPPASLPAVERAMAFWNHTSCNSDSDFPRFRFATDEPHRVLHVRWVKGPSPTVEGSCGAFSGNEIALYSHARDDAGRRGAQLRQLGARRRDAGPRARPRARPRGSVRRRSAPDSSWAS